MVLKYSDYLESKSRYNAQLIEVICVRIDKSLSRYGHFSERFNTHYDVLPVIRDLYEKAGWVATIKPYTDVDCRGEPENSGVQLEVMSVR